MSLPRLPLAITGGAATGKTTVLRVLENLGLPVGDADQVAQEVRSRPEVRRLIAHRFSLPTDFEPIDLRAKIANSTDRRTLNQILHPAIWNEMVCQRVIWEIPLLVETALWNYFDRVWLVTCSESTQFKRLVARMGDEHSARMLVGSQLNFRTRTPFSTRIVRTDGTHADVQHASEQASIEDSLLAEWQ